MQFILHILKTWRRRRKYFLQCKIIIKTILWFKAIFGITYFIYWRRRKFILPCFLLRIGERGAIRKILQKKKILILSCTKNYGTPCSEMLKKKKIYSSLFWIKKSWGYSTNWAVAAELLCWTRTPRRLSLGWSPSSPPSTRSGSPRSSQPSLLQERSRKNRRGKHSSECKNQSWIELLV